MSTLLLPELRAWFDLHFAWLPDHSLRCWETICFPCRGFARVSECLLQERAALSNNAISASCLFRWAGTKEAGWRGGGAGGGGGGADKKIDLQCTSKVCSSLGLPASGNCAGLPSCDPQLIYNLPASSTYLQFPLMAYIGGCRRTSMKAGGGCECHEWQRHRDHCRVGASCLSLHVAFPLHNEPCALASWQLNCCEVPDATTLAYRLAHWPGRAPRVLRKLFCGYTLPNCKCG